ncbi:MAG TPA: RidA family protein [Myxococcota bacterium]|jgi:2-iminobutanoate/2-iminopropanoate deaminase|nr:RidA family protein [Myxococcota bacterium]
MAPEPAREVRSADAPGALGPYSQAVVHGALVFASGQIPLDPATGRLVEGEIEAQTERVLANLRAVLSAAGSGLDRVLKSTVYLADLEHFARMNAVYARHFVAHPRPARSTVQVARLPLGALVEIDVVAAVG